MFRIKIQDVNGKERKKERNSWNEAEEKSSYIFLIN